MHGVLLSLPFTNPLSLQKKKQKETNKKKETKRKKDLTKMHIPRRKETRKYPKYSKPRKKCCLVNAAIKRIIPSQRSWLFLCCVKRESPQWRRQDLLINANKCNKLSYKASKSSFHFLLKDPFFFSASSQIISNQLIYSNKHIATLISSLPLAYTRSWDARFVVVTVVSGRQTWGY